MPAADVEAIFVWAVGVKDLGLEVVAVCRGGGDVSWCGEWEGKSEA